MKKLLIVCTLTAMLFSFAGCGDKEKGKETKLTKDTYIEVTQQEDWANMTPEDFNEYFGEKGTLDKKLTKEWGKEYKAYVWEGKNGKGTLTVLFHDTDGDGKFTPSSMTPSEDLK